MSLPILVLKHPNGLNNQGWNFLLLTWHREVSHQFILDNPKLPWDSRYSTKSTESRQYEDDDEIVSYIRSKQSYLSLLESSIDKYDVILRMLSDRMMDMSVLDWLSQHYSIGGLKMLPWVRISHRCILSIDLIDKYHGYLLINEMNYNRSLTVEVFDHINHILLQGGIFGSSLTSDNDVLATHNKWDIASVGRSIRLTIDFIDRYKDQLNLNSMLFNWNMTWEVANHIVKIRGSISKSECGWINYRLPPILDEIKKHSDVIDLNQWLKCQEYDQLNWDIVDYLETRIPLAEYWDNIARRVPLTDSAITTHWKNLSRAKLSLNRTLSLSMIKLYDL